jgi:hypothetical protein
MARIANHHRNRDLGEREHPRGIAEPVGENADLEPAIQDASRKGLERGEFFGEFRFEEKVGGDADELVATLGRFAKLELGFVAQSVDEGGVEQRMKALSVK